MNKEIENYSDWYVEIADAYEGGSQEQLDHLTRVGAEKFVSYNDMLAILTATMETFLNTAELVAVGCDTKVELLTSRLNETGVLNDEEYERMVQAYETIDEINQKTEDE